MQNHEFEVRQSTIHGRGVFTNRHIRRDEVFYIAPLEIVFDHAMPRRARIDGVGWVCDERVLNFVNHSCDPNARLVVQGGQPVLIANRTIAMGEEVVCDYCLTELGGEKTLCTCGSTKCKGFFLRII